MYRSQEFLPLWSAQDQDRLEHLKTISDGLPSPLPSVILTIEHLMHQPQADIGILLQCLHAVLAYIENLKPRIERMEIDKREFMAVPLLGILLSNLYLKVGDILVNLTAHESNYATLQERLQQVIESKEIDHD